MAQQPATDDIMEMLQVALAQSASHLSANMPAMKELIRLQAELTRVKYDSLLAQGFSDAQAIFLCRGH